MKKSSSRKRFTRTGIAILLVALCAWSPWLTAGTSAWLAEKQFALAWAFVMDGCGTRSPAAEVEFEKVPYGAYVSLEYRCGMIRPDEPYRRARVFISFLGTAHGYPAPWYDVVPRGQATPIPAIQVTP